MEHVNASPVLPQVDSVWWAPPGANLIKVFVSSFGYLWHPTAALPHGDDTVVVDLRKLLYNPFHDPAMRELTGLDPRIQDYVLTTPGAHELITATANLALTALDQVDARGLLVNVAIGCAGGRHRSVVIANAVCHLLNQRGVGSEVTHYDVLRPVYQKNAIQ